MKEATDEEGMKTKYVALSYIIVKGVKTSHSEIIRPYPINRMEDSGRCAWICKEKVKIKYKLKSWR